MIQSALFKLNSMFLGGMNIASIFGADGDILKGADSAKLVGGAFSLVFDWLVTLIAKIIYVSCSFVMSLIELIQFVIMKILGISVSVDDYQILDNSNPLIKILSSEPFTKAFRALLGVAIVLVVVFTIFAIVRSEYNFAAKDGPSVSKMRIFSRSLRSFFIMGIFPVFFLFITILVNAILAGFNDILKTENKNVSLAGQIFVSSAFKANNYRRYADADKRIPIAINFEDPISTGRDKGYSTEQLRIIYEDFEERGKTLYDNFNGIDFGSFSDTLIYRNNKVINQSSYAGYENFFCTREQYYVMADFMDYALRSSLNYHVKNMADNDIDWGYVDKSIFNKEEGTLTITYRDCSYLNDGESYTVVYAPESLEVSTPISDALKTVSALLGLNEYADNTFNTLSRLTDAINVVEWGTDKAWIQFSDDAKDLLTFDDFKNATNDEKAEAINSLTEVDKLLIYELNKFKYNNTLNFTVDELCAGVELPVYKFEKRMYRASSSSYIVTDTKSVVKINGTYYVVEENPELLDGEGKIRVDAFKEFYYTLVNPVTNTTLTWNSGLEKYEKQNDSAWSEITMTKINAEIEVVVEAEPIIDDVTSNGDDAPNGVYQPEIGETYKDLNGNGYWDEGYTYYVLYDDIVSDQIKQICWPQKLINDLQVIYADININQLITTNKWLEQLGEYNAKDDGSFSTENNISTALIHPLGLIMAEFFLGEVEGSDNTNSYGSVMFNSKFDSETIKALLLSSMGESVYFQLKAEVEYFCEIFNVFMGPVLDEIAYYENFDLMSGNDASVQLYSYKAYLASVMLSASTAEWMFETADKLLGGANFLRDIYVSEWNTTGIYGAYKTFKEFGTRCPDCGGDGYINEESETKCSNASCLDKSNTAHEIVGKYIKHKKQLEEQDIKEDDSDYPEYMVALKEYLFSGEDAFDGRLNCVLSSFLSNVARERKVIDAYNSIKTAYNELINGLNETTKENLNSIIYVPTAEFIAIDRDGNSYEFVSISNDEDIVSFKNKGLKDNFIMAETATSVQKLIKDIDRFKALISQNSITGLDDKLENYYSAIENYVNAKLDFLKEDTAHTLNEQRDKLARELKLLKITLIAAANIEQVKFSLIEYYEDKFGDTIDAAGATIENISEFINAENDLQKATAILKMVGQSVVNVANEIERLKELIDNLSELLTINNALVKCDYNKTREAWENFKIGKFDADGDNFYEIELEDNIVSLETYQNFIRTQETLDNLDRYYIFNGIKTLYSSTTDIEFKVTVNNKEYLVGQNFTEAKFIEYVCGSEYLKELKYETVFVDDDYKGLVNLNEGVLVGSFNNLNKFLVELGDVSAKVYQLTNFMNLSENAKDEIKIGKGDGSSFTLSRIILNWILNDSENYLANDLIYSLFGLEEGVISEAKTNAGIKINGNGNLSDPNYKPPCNDEEADRILNNVLSYLFLTDSDPSKKNYFDYTTLTLKELRLKAFEFLINYQEQEGESVEQNQKRYLAVFALSCADWCYEESGVLKFADSNCWAVENKGKIADVSNGGKLYISTQSQAIVLRLAGLENRPYEELVGAEYTIDFNRKGVDEANGDVFIICTYDEQRRIYIPFLMGNTNEYEFKESKGFMPTKHPTTENTWQVDYGYYQSSTNYYMNEKFYPVVAKGIITEEGRPTAIRQVGDDIEYYRDDAVIHDVSNIGLSTYYVSLDQIKVRNNVFTYVANSFSKLFTGKSLVENLVSKIPKFATTTDYKLCYGTERKVVETSTGGSVAADYNFKAGICLSRDSLYSLKEINIIVLLIGTFTLFSAIWKALWGVTQRMFDVAILYLLGPVAISTVAMRSDASNDGKIVESDSDAYSKWKATLIEKTLSVFSYSIGFNVFFIVSPIISGVNLFASQLEFNQALSYSSVFRHIDVIWINEIARLVLTIASAYLCTKGTELLVSILKISNGFTEGAATLSNVKAMINEVGDHVSGQYALDKVEDLKDQVKQAIPGSEFISEAYGKVKGFAQGVVLFGAEKYMEANGVPPEVAHKLTEKLGQQIKKKEEEKEKKKEKRQKARQKRDESRK